MLKFNRKTEYGLIALRYMASRRSNPEVVSAREISDYYKIPYPVMSKVMQTLHVHKIIDSLQGTRGGYRIRKPLGEISLSEVVRIFQGPVEVTDCVSKNMACTLKDSCNVRTIFNTINQRLNSMLDEINLGDLEEPNHEAFASQGGPQPGCGQASCRQKVG